MSGNLGIFKCHDSALIPPGCLRKRQSASLSCLFSHSSHGYYYGSLSTQMVTFKLIKHKDRQKLCPENLPNLNQRQQLRRGHRKASGGNPALPSSVHRLKKEPSGAHLSAQTEWSSLSIKEPLRSTRPATGCHCYSTHNSKPAFPSGVGSRRDPGSPSPHLSQNCHPFRFAPKAHSL